MDGATDLPSTQIPDNATVAGGAKGRSKQIPRIIGFAFLGIGLILFVVSCFIMRAHPQPFPIDIATTQTLQNLQDVRWAATVLHFVGAANEPGTAPIAVGICFAALVVMGLIFKRRGKSAVRWFVAAILLAVAAGGTFALNQLIDHLVNRPRPSSDTAPIRHHTLLVPVPTYPSGHVEYVTIFYGFLLYLSFTRPVREWRYRWLLIPIQLYAVFNLLGIGISRIVELDHWLTDVLGAYFEGALYLVAFIFLYLWTVNKLEERRARRLAQKSTQGQPA